MAAFLSRTVDGVLLRGGRRAALDQFWTPQAPIEPGRNGPLQQSALHAIRRNGRLGPDGRRERRPAGPAVADGRVLGTWTGVGNTNFVLVAMGRIFGSGARRRPGSSTGSTRARPPTAATILACNLADGRLRRWPSTEAGSGSARLGALISIVTPTARLPWTVTTVSLRDAAVPVAPALRRQEHLDGRPDLAASALLKLDAAGADASNGDGRDDPVYPATFDGTNIWVPNALAASVTVVRASSGAVLDDPDRKRARPPQRRSAVRRAAIARRQRRAATTSRSGRPPTSQ